MLPAPLAGQSASHAGPNDVTEGQTLRALRDRHGERVRGSRRRTHPYVYCLFRAGPRRFAQLRAMRTAFPSKTPPGAFGAVLISVSRPGHCAVPMTGAVTHDTVKRLTVDRRLIG